MSISITEVSSKSDLKAFIKFPMNLYKDVSSYVPPLISFEISTLDPKKNPAFNHAEATYWVARKNDQLVGRIAGIILDQELSDKKLARFGWIDFVDDLEVSAMLLDTVTAWAKSKGATGLHGPLGFTDLDFEGALIDGFEHTATQATIYNAPYYQKHYEAFGFEKAVDWTETRGVIPPDVPEKLKRGAAMSKERYGFRSVTFKKKKELLKYATRVFELINRTYSNLYGYYELSPAQIDYYIKQYFDFVKLELISLIVNEEDEVVAMAITLPSISEALKKAKGSLFPFGFIHVLKAFNTIDQMDLFLIAVDQKYQKSGVHAIIFEDLHTMFNQFGAKTFATGPMLEGNRGVQNLWTIFSAEVTATIRRRCYIKTI
ncbi:hypothetical protein [Marinoscillum sp.]|uniref:hypothetical protein n=1 Tax=Marinoscillum sp. TaxID=2024838 RepID=UPI003BA9F872